MTKKYSLLQKIIHEPQQLDIHQLIYLLETMRPLNPRFGKNIDPHRDVIKVVAHPETSPSSTVIESLQLMKTGRPKLSSNIFSLVNLNAPLPEPFKELILERLKAKDTAMMAFLDVFHHRLMALYHLFQAKRFPHLSHKKSYHSPAGVVMRYLSGYQLSSVKQQALFFDCLWRQSRSLQGLLLMLNGLTNITFQVMPHQGSWKRAPNTDGSYLCTRQEKHNVLGQSLILGTGTWDQNAGFDLLADNLSFEQIKHFVPFKNPKLGGSTYTLLKKSLRQYLGTLPKVSLCLRLKNDDNQATTLNGKQGLGFNTWLAGDPPEQTKIVVN